MWKDKEMEKPLTTSEHEDEIVKEVRRRDESHVPLTTGEDKCGASVEQQIDLGCSTRANDCLNGKETRGVTLLEKGKMLAPLAAIFLSVAVTAVLSRERKRTTVLYLCLGGIGVVSFVIYLLLRWRTTRNAAHRFKSLQAVAVDEPEHTTTTTVTASENGDKGGLSLLTKKVRDDGRLHLQPEELTRSRQDSECATNPSHGTPKTDWMSLTRENESDPLAFGHVQMEDEAASRKTLLKKKSIGSSQRLMSRKRGDRRLSGAFHRKRSSQNMMPRPELIDDPKYADIPLRYKVGCLYDIEEARRRWDLTVAWREKEGIDDIIYDPDIQKHFETIKKYYPHWICGKSIEGHLVYYEQPGNVNMKALHEAGLTVDSMIRYYVFICEVIWRKMDLREDDGKLVTVFYCEGIRFRDIWSEAMKFTRGASAVVQAHYVERCARIYVVNIPSWFAKVWTIVKPLVDSRTLEKVKIFRHVTHAIEEMKNDVDPKLIPVEYGGEAIFGDGSPGQSRWHAPEELEYCRIAKSLPLVAPNNYNQSANGA